MPIPMKSFLAKLSMILTLSVPAMAQENDNHSEEEEHPNIEERLALMKGAKVYSCNLQAYSHQCREYPIPKDVEFKIPVLTEGCESMPRGKFQLGECPSEERVGRCIKVLRNNHDTKSLIYDNHYYQGIGSPWSLQEVERVCADLEGTMAKD